MSDMWRKTLVYLGLVEEPEEHDEHEDREVSEPPPPVRRTRREPAAERAEVTDTAENVRPLRSGEVHVRAVQGAGRVAIVRPASFDDAAEIGERYRSNQAVLLDLGEVDNRTGRRLLDFISGTIFALSGRVVPAGERAFLLVPDGVDLPPDERRRLTDLGYRVQPSRSSSP